MDHDAEGGRLFITGQGGVSDHCIAKSVAEVSNTRRLVDAFDEGGGSVHKSHLEFGAEKVVHNDGQGVVRLQVLERVGERETWLEFSKKNIQTKMPCNSVQATKKVLWEHSNAPRQQKRPENTLQDCDSNKNATWSKRNALQVTKTPWTRIVTHLGNKNTV